MTTLVIQMSPKMARAVSRGADLLQLPSNQDFALKAMGQLLRTMGLTPKAGRPVGFAAGRHRQFRESKQREARNAPRRIGTKRGA